MKGQERAAEALTSLELESWDDPDRADGAGSAKLKTDVPDVAAALRRRVLELEAELRSIRVLLEVRNEAFRALMARLVSVESHRYAADDRLRHAEYAQLIAERDAAVELATVLQNMKIFRYTTWPRAFYGALRRLRRRR